jgi:Tfp pilus assembly protein PilN
MKALRLEFKRRSRRVTAAGAALLLAGLLVAGQLAVIESDLRSRTRAAEAKVARLETEGRRRVQPQAGDSAARQLEIHQANEILRQLALPWHGLFKVIESSNEKEIALLAVQPDPQRRLLRLTGEAKNFDALLAYVTRLEASDVLSQVFITQHEIRTQDPEKPVRFALVANWVAQQ